jgi:hypothetical protein
MEVLKIGPKRWAVIDDEGRVASEHDTNSAAWRALDRLQNEPINKREAIADWVFRKIPAGE